MNMRAILVTGLAAFVMVAQASSVLADEIRVLNWKGYGTDEPWALELFKKETGHSVIHDYFNSEQEMLTKLRTNPGLYDVVMITTTFTDQAIDENLLQPINVANISQAAHIEESQMTSPMIVRGDNQYGIPWVWGITALGVSDKSFPNLPTSISVLWDEAYKGRVVLRDDAIEAVHLGAIATGQDINDIQDMEAVKQKIAAMIANVRTFWSSENEWNQMLATGQIDLGVYWSGAADRARVAFNLPVSFVIPEEGAIGWADTLAIPQGAKNVAAAEAFINFMISPHFYAQWYNSVGAPASANPQAIAALPEDAFVRVVMGDPENRARIQFRLPVPEEKERQYLEMWQQLKLNAR